MDRDEAQVYIGYLPNQARMSDVEEFFKGFGHIKSINLKPGYGFVVFEDRRDAEEAARVRNLQSIRILKFIEGP